MDSAPASSQHTAQPATVIVQAIPLSQGSRAAATATTATTAAPPPMAMAIPAPVTKAMPFEGLNSSVAANVPYAVVQPTPGALPPIATARPVHGIGAINSHLSGGSNIPMINAQQQQTSHLPHIATNIPTGADYEHSQFQFMDKTRWFAGFMLMYYIGTFLFFQPFCMGMIGIMTAFIGFYGARAPMDAVRMKWVRSYLWLNYVMIVFNLCLLAMTAMLVVINNASTATPTATMSSTDDDSVDNLADVTSHSAGIVVAILVTFNVLLHVRGIQTARVFYAELVRAQVQLVQPAVIMAPAHAV